MLDERRGVQDRWSKMAKQPKKSRALVSPDKSAREQQVVQIVKGRSQERTRAPNLKMEHDEETNHLEVEFDHEDQKTAFYLAMADMGTCDGRFSVGLLTHIAGLGEAGKSHSAWSSDFALSVVKAVEPKDEVEAMLAAQMAAVHQATMSMARKLNIAEYVGQSEAAERGLTKLARTFASQVEALKRYRSNGQQTVRVERVEVNEGGKAIVGDVSYRRGEDDET